MLDSFIIGRNKISKWLKKCWRISLFSPNVVFSWSYQFPYNFPVLFNSWLFGFGFFFFIWHVLSSVLGFFFGQFYLDKICDHLFLYGSFTSWDFPHFRFIALFCQGCKMGTDFFPLHIKTTSYMQQINGQQLHTPSSVFPLFPTIFHVQSNASNDLILPRTFPETFHIMAALICF